MEIRERLAGVVDTRGEGVKPFSRLRWIFLCGCGFWHRRGESVHLSTKGAPLRRSSRCTRCGVKGEGLGH